MIWSVIGQIKYKPRRSFGCVEPEIGTSIIGAIEFWATDAQQSRITMPSGYVLYQEASGPLAALLASKHILTTASAPTRVQRFAASSSAARFGSVVSYMIEQPHVWKMNRAGIMDPGIPI
jgi:hypothetical protein